ncbi:MAG: signal recognition particle subunit SRP19 [Halobacteriales archaeon]|nr:signal recognition particle subunit SRP19 [Halobacteriales archaeon]
MVEKVIWPAYLDSDRSRREGRRVPEDEAIDDPEVDEIAAAVQQVGYDAVIERDATYPREPWRECGRVRVRNADDTGKNDLVRAVAAYVAVLRE